jgi:hypothetical protein
VPPAGVKWQTSEAPSTQNSGHAQVADDTVTVTAHLLDLMAEVPGSGKQVHDTNLVATMLAYGIPALLTQNVGDFQRFGDRITVESFG